MAIIAIIPPEGIKSNKGSDDSEDIQKNDEVGHGRHLTAPEQVGNVIYHMLVVRFLLLLHQRLCCIVFLGCFCNYS